MASCNPAKDARMIDDEEKMPCSTLAHLRRPLDLLPSDG